MTAMAQPRGTVCFCNSNRAWGGGERWHLEATLAMAKRGWRVILLADRDGPLLKRGQELAREHPELTALPVHFTSLSFLNPVTLLRWRCFFRREGVSRLVLGLPTDMKAAGLAAKMAGVERIYYRRGSAVPVRGSRLNRLLYGRVLDGVIVNSRETERLLLSRCPGLICREKIHLLFNGIDAQAFDGQLAAAEAEFREGDTFLIGNAGRMTVQKGQKFLLHMSRTLKDKGFPHRVILAGEGELEESLRRLAKDLDVRDTVRFAGFRQDLGSFWKSLDLFVLPSLWEGFGFVLAEAMLAQIPLLGFDANSMPELIRSGVNGEVIPPPKPDESDHDTGSRLAEAVLGMAGNREKLREQGGQGRAIALAEYDQESCMCRLDSLLQA